MVDAPARFVFEGGEERVVDCMSDLYNGTTDEFAKAFLVAYFFAEGNTPDEDDLLA